MNDSFKILLNLDLQVAAKSIGLKSNKTQSLVTEANLFLIMNEIEIALLEGNKDRQISSVCGLLWTHFSEEFDLLGEYIFNTMVQLGFQPVISMLSTNKSKNTRIAYSSLFSMLETTANMQREKVEIFDNEYFLTRFQKNLWTQIESNSHIGVSAPTSAGKSFLICLNLIYGTAKRGGISIYIVPTLTLMGQVANDLIDLIRKHKQSISVRTHLSDDTESNIPIIFVVTQERIADYHRLRNLGELNFLVIDEIQNIERAFEPESNDTRAKLLFDVVVDLHDNYKPQKTIIIGPRISEVSILGQTLFRKIFTSVIANASPVTNICYSISPAKDKDMIVLTQHSELCEQHLSMTFDNLVGATGFGKSQYNDDYFSYIEKALNKNEGSLIFSPTSIQARRTAVRLSGKRELSNDPMLKSLRDYVKSTVSPKYDLASCIEKGVVYHHGKIPHHVRNAIELAIAQGRISYVACTTTLMQGVNIPAKNVFLRNPNLFINRRSNASARLSGYEIANLRGRAGRLLKDFVGRTFIMDGTSFNEAADQKSLFEPASKTLDGSYSKIFQRTRHEIIDSLSRPNNDRGTLAKYIANVLYTDPSGAASLLRKGINLSESELIAIKNAQLKIDVPIEICRSHRFWDPFDLQKIKNEMSGHILPKAPFAIDAVNNLEKILVKIFSILPEQSGHYLKTHKFGNKYALMLAISSINWAGEKPLRDLLDSDFARDSSENTERSISNFQNIISYGVPSLLSPLYSLFAPQSMLLSAIERGAYQPGIVAQINNNIPRETAIAVISQSKRQGESLTSMVEVLNYLKRVKLDYWSAIQYRHIIDVKEILK